MDNSTQQKIGSSIIILSLFLIILLIFVKQDLDTRDTYLCQVFHENPGLDMLQCPAHTTNTSWYIVAAFGFAFLVLGAGVYLVIGSWTKSTSFQSFQSSPSSQVSTSSSSHSSITPSREPTYAPLDLEQLDVDEKKVYQQLKEHQGSLYQSDLLKQLATSKVHLTRILDKMESKQILERKRRGMTNIVVLK